MSAVVVIPVAQIDQSARIPGYAYPGDAGADLRTTTTLRLKPGDRATVPTGVAVAIPSGHVGLVTPRSGLASRGLTLVNSPGVIDSGYRGEIRVIVLNTDAEASIDLGVGDRIAQLVIVPVVEAAFEWVEELPIAQRAEHGFGSSGVA